MIVAWMARKNQAICEENYMKILLRSTFFILLLLTACNLPAENEGQATQVVEPIIPTLVSSSTPTVTPAPTATPSPPPTQDQSVYGPTNFPPDVNPLTGLRVADPELLERRPMAVKVQIFPRGQRPPWGISSADIVYDYYQNNGLTRFHAIFLGTDSPQVGPIRSARLFDGELSEMYKSILAFGGADSRILTKLFNSPISNQLILEGNSNCPPLCRVDPNGFNYLMTNTQHLSEYAEQQGISNTRQNLDGMTFNSSSPAGGQPQNPIVVRFSISSYNRWDYEIGTGRYLRSQDIHESPDIATQGYAPLIDQLTGTQIATDNVVMILAPNQFTPGSKPGKSEIVDIQLEGSGQAFAFRDGYKFDVQWHRPESSSILFLTMADGSPYPFKPGTTWFEVVGQSSTVDMPGDGSINFQFSIP